MKMRPPFLFFENPKGFRAVSTKKEGSILCKVNNIIMVNEVMYTK